MRRSKELLEEEEKIRAVVIQLEKDINKDKDNPLRQNPQISSMLEKAIDNNFSHIIKIKPKYLTAEFGITESEAEDIMNFSEDYDNRGKAIIGVYKSINTKMFYIFILKWTRTLRCSKDDKYFYEVEYTIDIAEARLRNLRTWVNRGYPEFTCIIK